MAGLTALGGLAATPAWADGSVTVNPMAARPGRYLLVAPDSTIVRFVPTLLQPGQTSSPVDLHMPTERRRIRQTETPRPKKTQTASAAPPPEVHKEPRKEVPRELPKQASATPPASPAPARPAPAARTAPASSGYSSSLTGPGSLFNGPALTLHPTGSTAPEKQPAPQTDTRPPAEKQSSAEPPTRVAKAEPAPESSLPGTSRRSVILFAKDATEPMASALDQIRLLAGDLNAAMTRPSSRIELRAYGGPRGDKGSDARRLALKRALAIRQVLIDDGVNAGRIDVRAMGGAENGPADRVDIYVRT